MNRLIIELIDRIDLLENKPSVGQKLQRIDTRDDGVWSETTHVFVAPNDGDPSTVPFFTLPEPVDGKLVTIIVSDAFPTELGNLRLIEPIVVVAFGPDDVITSGTESSRWMQLEFAMTYYAVCGATGWYLTDAVPAPR